MQDLGAQTTGWVASALPQVYGLGGLVGASQAGGQFTWTAVHREAVQLLVDDTFNDLLAATRHVARTTKQLVRAVVRDEALQKAIEGKSPFEAAREVRRILEANNISAVVYKDGSKHGLAEYSRMVMRTKTATAYNQGTINGAAHEGVQWWQAFDGPECGWTFHEDPTPASGRMVMKDEALEFVISHPQCRRSFGARPDVTSQEGARAAEQENRRNPPAPEPALAPPVQEARPEPVRGAARTLADRQARLGRRSSRVRRPSSR